MPAPLFDSINHETTEDVPAVKLTAETFEAVGLGVIIWFPDPRFEVHILIGHSDGVFRKGSVL